MAEKAAEALARGLRPTKALREAGYPPSTVNKARLGINRTIWAKFKEKSQRYIELGKITPEDQENLVRGRLIENVILGTDKGAMSAKQLGADKRISMWQPDSSVGLVVLQAPEPRKIKHEVKWLEPVHSDDEEPESSTDSGQQNPEMDSAESEDKDKGNGK
jgi:hypothetical protein